MAEDEIIGQTISSVGDGLSFINTTTVFIFIALMMSVALIILVMHVMKHKHTIVLRNITSGRKIVSKVKFREYRGKDGTLWYRLMNGKSFPPAPAECIDVQKNGKMWVEAYINESDEVTYNKDTGVVHAKYLADEPDVEKIKGFDSLTTNHRQLYLNQLEKAYNRKGKGWKEHLATIFYVSSLTLIIIMGMIMYGEIAQPILDANGQALEMKKLDNEQLKLLQDIKNNVQSIQNTQTSKEDAPIEPPN